MKILEIMNDVRSDLFTQEMINRTLNKALYGDDYINSKSFISIKVKLDEIGSTLIPRLIIKSTI